MIEKFKTRLSGALASAREWLLRAYAVAREVAAKTWGRWNVRGRLTELDVQGRLERLRAKSGMEPALATRLAMGLGLIVLLFGSFGVWAATTPIAGAVIASGVVVVESNIKKVQHAAGGIV